MQDMQKRSVVVVALLTAVSLLGDSMLYIALPLYHQQVGILSLLEVGVLLSANRLVRLPLNPLVSWLYQRIELRTGLAFAVLTAAITTLGYGWSKQFAIWLLLRCLWGVAWTFLRLGAYFTILSVTNEQNRGHYMGTYNGLYRLGSLVGMLGGGLLVDRFGLPHMAFLFGVMPLFALPFVFRFVPSSKLTNAPTRHSAAQTARSERREKLHLRQPDVFWTVLSSLLIALIYQGAFTSTLSPFIQSNRHAQLLFGTVITGAAGLSGLIQGVRWVFEPWLAPWFGRLSDSKLGRRPLMIGALLLGGLCFLLLHADLPIVLWLLVLFAIQISATALTTLIDAVASDVANTVPKVIFMTLYSVAIDCGAAFGPMLSYISTKPGFLAIVYWAAGAILCLLALQWLLFAKRKAAQPSLSA